MDKDARSRRGTLTNRKQSGGNGGVAGLKNVLEKDGTGKRSYRR
jgi:hypothetical protein